LYDANTILFKRSEIALEKHSKEFTYFSQLYVKHRHIKQKKFG